MKAKPTKPKGGKGGKKKESVKQPAVKKSVAKSKVRKRRNSNPEDLIFIEDEAEPFFERLTVIRGILRQQKADHLHANHYSAAAYPSLPQIEQSLESVLLDIEGLSTRGLTKEFAWLCQAVALWIFQMLPIHEDEFEDVARFRMSDKIFTLYKREWDKRAKSPNRKSAAIREGYQAACKQAIIEAVILHEAGIRKHWLRPQTPMPAERWGSDQGKANWHAWIRTFLAGMHKSGELFRLHSNSPAKGDFAGARAKSRDQFFSELYIISLNFMQPVFKSTARLLYSHYAKKPCPEPFNTRLFIDLLCRMHPEIAPQRPPTQTA